MIAAEAEHRKMCELAERALEAGLAVPSPSECDALRVDYAAVSSLYNQMSVRQLKRDVKRGVDAAVLSSLRDGIALADIAKRCNVGGYKLVRLYLEYRFGYGAVTLTHFLETPTIIPDEKLRQELLSCLASDPFCSLPVEQLKECTGKEYEEYLIARLQEKGLCFETEAELRSRGKPKTPDVLFLIPMATPHCNRPSCGPVVVNWIDSKAMFADEDTLAEHFEQLRGYTNRYGRGLVIYWHGYVETITSSSLFASADDMIMISHTFPEEWFTLN